MPVANIQVLAGHPRPLLKQLLREASATLSRVMQAPPDRLQVWITEVDPELYAIAGEPADEVLLKQPRADTENPMIKMVLLEGRPVEKLQEVMAALTEVTARILGGDPKRIRVQIDLVSADRWAIGGVSVTAQRAAQAASAATPA